jgi:hypothetical protein
MTAVPHSRTSPAAKLWKFIVEHNPFYLLSAACMLASILALTNSLSWSPIATRRLLTLIVTLNIYEAILIALALFLIVKRGLVRDGKMLLILEAFFLVDTTFLNAELVTAHYTLGVTVNFILFVLAAVKIGVVLHVLYPSFSIARFGYILLQLAVLFAVPCVLRKMDHGSITPAHLYGAWWTLAILPALHEAMVRHPNLNAIVPAIVPSLHRPAAAPIHAYLALPWASLLLHVCILHYVYDATFFGAHATPALLGLALVMNRAEPTRLLPRKDLLAMRLLLPAGAVLASITNPHALAFSLGTYFHFTPLSLAMGGAFLIYVYSFFASHALILIGAASVAYLVAMFGPAPSSIWNSADALRRWMLALTDRLTPKTTGQWGVLGLVASFVFLGIGALVSLHKRPPMTPAPVPTSSDEPPPL